MKRASSQINFAITPPAVVLPAFALRDLAADSTGNARGVADHIKRIRAQEKAGVTNAK